MDEIKDIVRCVIKDLSEKKPEKNVLIHKVWVKILTKKELVHSRIDGQKSDTLRILVDSPAWLFQLNLKKKRLLEEIQKEVPEIKKIYFKLGRTA